LFARRLDPARAQLLNVPLATSGYRWGDIVLHDGARTGERDYGGGRVPVFNVLERLERSDFATHAVFVTCPRPADVEELLGATGPGLGAIEDWSASLQTLCLRCSYNLPHEHATPVAADTWQPERTLGIAAQGRAPVDALLARWQSKHRTVGGIEVFEVEPAAPPSCVVWWRDPDEAAAED
jgi:hypothetical protein